MRRYGAASVCALLLLGGTAFAQGTKITYEEYKTQMAGFEKRTADAKRANAECMEAGNKLATQIAEADGQIAATKADLYRLVDSNEAGVKAYMESLARTEAQIMSLLALSDEQLADKKDEVDGIGERIKGFMANKISLIPEAATKLDNIQRQYKRLAARVPGKRIKKYTVVRGDNLWQIAGRQDMLKDPYLWPRIYLENHNLIKNPDLIYPKWVLDVPIGVDRGQHMVMRGQTLSTVAGIVYKDVTKWNRIYEANKRQIMDPNLVFPAQVLDIPAN
jgi:nucleoid-associated protein YgaU